MMNLEEHRPSGTQASPPDCRAIRIPLRVPVTVTLAANGHYEFTGISRNLSASGLFLNIYSGTVHEGAEVEATLTLPSRGSEPIPIKVSGRVVRVEHTTPAGVAIAFKSLIIAPLHAAGLV